MRLRISTSPDGGREGRAHAAIFLSSALIVFSFLLLPTIDADEGYFLHGGVHALRSAWPGFPWVDALYDRPHLYIPLNSLDTLINWPIAYLPQPLWLVCGRLVSAFAVCSGILLLYVCQRNKPAAKSDTAVWLFAATCLPLILIARVIRPDGIVFLGVCGALVLAPLQRRIAALAAGLLIAIVALAHAVYGVLAAATIAGFILFSPASSNGARIGRLLAFCAGAAIPVMLFYGVYSLIEAPSAIFNDAKMLMSMLPRSATSFSPAENLIAWARHLQGQANMWPLILFAGLAIVMPSDKADAGHVATIFLKTVLAGLLLFWIFLYPRKAFTIVVLLLPISIVVLGACRTMPWHRFAKWALAVCLAANTVLLVRYHWRLLQVPGGYEQIAPIAVELERQHFNRPQIAVLGKPWLVFILPQTAVLWDISAYPAVLGNIMGRSAGIAAAVGRREVVVLEWQAGQWGDDIQAGVAEYLTQAGWRQISVPIVRYFQPLEARIFLPP